jgi:hypothetical protein
MRVRARGAVVPGFYNPAGFPGKIGKRGDSPGHREASPRDVLWAQASVLGIDSETPVALEPGGSMEPNAVACHRQLMLPQRRATACAAAA